MPELPGKPADAGFLIAEEFYPYPTSFRLIDPILVEELTGMGWGEFALAIDERDSDNLKPLIGMVAVAIWQKHPEWKREKVVKFVSDIDFENLDFTTPEGEDDVDPPAVTPDATSTPGDPSASTEESSDMTLGSIGLQSSEITAV